VLVQSKLLKERFQEKEKAITEGQVELPNSCVKEMEIQRFELAKRTEKE